MIYLHNYSLYIFFFILSELENYHVLRYEEKSTTHKCKINFTHTSTGINCELAYLGSKPDKILNMGKFLKEMCKLDPRVRPLITATKIWAEVTIGFFLYACILFILIYN